MKKLANKTNFLMSAIKGFGIGIAVIIPGFSGGTLAVILGIYDQIIEAISDITKHFWKSVLTLLPIVIGAGLAVLALVVPLRLAFQYFPLPTVSLFVGLVIGGIPPLIEEMSAQVKWKNGVILVVTLAIAVGICFIKGSGYADLTKISLSGGLLLALMGVLGSVALVVPGISGSMLLLILGYWEPIRATLESLMSFQNFGHDFAVMAIFGVGILVGFYFISKLMNYLLKNHRAPTFWGIVGFIVGSIFSIYYTIENPIFNTLQIVLSIVLLVLGAGLSLLLIKLQKKKENENKPKAQE